MKKIFSFKTWLSLFVVISVVFSFVMPVGAATNDSYQSEYLFEFAGSGSGEPRYRSTDETKKVSFTGCTPYFSVYYSYYTLRYALYLPQPLTNHNPFLDTRVTYFKHSDIRGDNIYYYMQYLPDPDDLGFGVDGQEYYLAARFESGTEEYPLIVHSGIWNL